MSLQPKLSLEKIRHRYLEKILCTSCLWYFIQDVSRTAQKILVLRGARQKSLSIFGSATSELLNSNYSLRKYALWNFCYSRILVCIYEYIVRESRCQFPFCSTPMSASLFTHGRLDFILYYICLLALLISVQINSSQVNVNKPSLGPNNPWQFCRIPWVTSFPPGRLFPDLLVVCVVP